MSKPERRSKMTAVLALLVLTMLASACGGGGAVGEAEFNGDFADDPAADEAEFDMEAMEEAAPANEEELAEFDPLDDIDEGIGITTDLGGASEVDTAAVDSDTQQSQLAFEQQERLVIKDGRLKLLVSDIERALGEVANVAARYGGYVLSSQSEASRENRSQSGEISITVQSQNFDLAMADLRQMGLRVLSESSSGEDVTSEFVDLQSRLINLTATAERLRGFLDQAETVDEALDINNELTKIEGDIEEVRGRMNYVQTRAALSTITVQLEVNAEPSPTPTATATSSATPTPTVTPTTTATATVTLTPTATRWSPGVQVSDALHNEGIILQNILHSAVSLLVFIGINLIPTLLPFAVLGGLGWLSVRRWLQIRNGSRPPVRSDDDE